MSFIDPQPPKSDRCVEWDGGNDIPPFSRGCPPERDDVGIVPYIPSGCMPLNRAGMGTFLGRGDVGIDPYISAGLRAIQPGASSPWGCGRLVAAPTGVLVCVPFIRAGCI